MLVGWRRGDGVVITSMKLFNEASDVRLSVSKNVFVLIEPSKKTYQSAINIMIFWPKKGTRSLKQENEFKLPTSWTAVYHDSVGVALRINKVLGATDWKFCIHRVSCTCLKSFGCFKVKYSSFRYKSCVKLFNLCTVYNIHQEFADGGKMLTVHLETGWLNPLKSNVITFCSPTFFNMQYEISSPEIL